MKGNVNVLNKFAGYTVHTNHSMQPCSLHHIKRLNSRGKKSSFSFWVFKCPISKCIRSLVEAHSHCRAYYIIPEYFTARHEQSLSGATLI